MSKVTVKVIAVNDRKRQSRNHHLSRQENIQFATIESNIVTHTGGNDRKGIRLTELLHKWKPNDCDYYTADESEEYF